MVAQFGFSVLVFSFVTALFAIGAAVYGYFRQSQRWVDSARNAMLLSFPLITVSALTLIYLIGTNHFELDFVYSVTSRSMPTYLKVTALWGGQAGSLLFWSWLMSLFASAVMLRKWDRDREFLPWVIVVSSVTLAFFLGLVVFYENAFARYWQTFDGNVVTAMFQPQGSVPFTPSDGRGLNPLLRHPGMIIHPPMLYLGFVSFVIPFAFAIAALVTGRTDDRWIRLTRRWTLVAWLFLSLGLVLGGRWAYDVLGWGGYWGWDPVEIAAFMPWLTGTAFIHSVMIQEKRGMFKHWNTLLIILTYSLVIFGTFLTRSGVLSSVHAFAQSAIGPAFFIFIGVTFIASASLLIYRWNDLKGESEVKSPFSREAFFLANNLLFMVILVVCFWGVIFPLISELATGQKVTVGPPFYESANSPLFALLLLLMAVVPLTTWGISSEKRLGKVNWFVLGPLLALPAVPFVLLRNEIISLTGSSASMLIFFIVIEAAVTVVYLFRHIIWKPLIPAVLITVLIAVTMTRNPLALTGFFLAALVACVTLYDIWRGVRARERATQENFLLAAWRLVGRNRRRYGGYIIHFSIVLMSIGILGLELFQTETQGTIAQGESLQLAGYTLTYKDLAIFDTADARNIARAVVEVSKDGQFITELHPRRDYFYESQQPMTIPGVRSTLQDDLYVILIDWQPILSTGATFKVYHNPLVNWLWIGSLVFLFGALVTVWPDKDPEYETARARTSSSRQASAAD